MFCKCPVTIDDAQHCAILTMSGTSIQALFALVAYNVDLPHYALADPGGIICFNHVTDKLMTQDACIWIVTLDQFKVSPANARFAYFDQRFIGFVWSRDMT